MNYLHTKKFNSFIVKHWASFCPCPVTENITLTFWECQNFLFLFWQNKKQKTDGLRRKSDIVFVAKGENRDNILSIKELRSRAFLSSNSDSYRAMSIHKINNQSHRRYCFFTFFTKKVRSVILLGKWPDKLNYKKKGKKIQQGCVMSFTFG